MTTAFIAVAFFAAAAVLFLFAVTIARAAADIEDVDDGRGFGGDYDADRD